jgi:hypothetical protein
LRETDSISTSKNPPLGNTNAGLRCQQRSRTIGGEASNPQPGQCCYSGSRGSGSCLIDVDQPLPTESWGQPPNHQGSCCSTLGPQCRNTRGKRLSPFCKLFVRLTFSLDTPTRSRASSVPLLRRRTACDRREGQRDARSCARAASSHSHLPTVLWLRSAQSVDCLDRKSTASLRIDRDGNSLPLPGKSTGWPENAIIGLKIYPLLG